MLEPVNLSAAFARFTDAWSPKVVGDVNDMQVKVARFRGDFVWHRHEAEDELFLVHRGRMVMRLRDRELVLGPGELLIVPRGVEHCPGALDGECEVVLFEPRATLNTGDAEDPRTVRAPERLA